MNKIVPVISLFASLATGCAYHEGVVAVPPAPVEIGSIGGATMRSGTRVIINLSEQRAYLIEGGKVSLVSPIASGKPGWSTPTGNFSVISKDIAHRSQSLGLIIDGSGRIASSSATPGTHVPPGFHYQPAPMALLHGIHRGHWHACRLSSRVSRIPRVRADASRPRGTVFRTGQYSNSGDGRRQHAEPDIGPKKPSHCSKSL